MLLCLWIASFDRYYSEGVLTERRNMHEHAMSWWITLKPSAMPSFSAPSQPMLCSSVHFDMNIEQRLLVHLQVMKTCEALRSAGFHSVTTIEFRLRNINYAEVQLDVPDFGSNPATPAPAPAAALKKASEVPSSTESAPPTPDGSNGAAGTGAPESTEGVLAREEPDESMRKASEKEKKEGLGADGNGVTADVDKAADSVAASRGGASPKENGSACSPAAGSGSNKRPREGASASGDAPGESGVGDGGGDGDGDGEASNAGRGRNERLPPKAAIRAAEAAARQGGARKPPMKLVCAQPFPLMRGHTAFLTFATTPVARQLGTAAAVTADGAAVGADGAAIAAAVAEEGESGSISGGLEGESSHTGNDGSGCGTDSGDGCGIEGGGEMDVCEEEGATGEAKGRGREASKPPDEAKGNTVATVSHAVDSSSVDER